MKKLVVIIGLLLSLSLVNIAGAEDEKPSVFGTYLEKMEPSIVKLETYEYEAIPTPPFEREQKLGAGTGFVVAHSEKETVVVTAKHVVDATGLDGVLRVKARFRGEVYTALYKSLASEMDAAYIVFTPGIKGAKPISLNLSPDDSVVEALAFGFGQSIHIKGEPQKHTFTHGYISRKVCEKMAVGKDCELVRNIIYGTATVLFGYSGGPVVDTDMKVLGINMAIGGNKLIYVDIRGVYNWMKHKIPGAKGPVKIPYDPAFEVYNRNELSRVPVKGDGVLEVPEGKVTFKDLTKMLNEHCDIEAEKVGPFTKMKRFAKPIYDWVKFETLLTVDGKSYKVKRVMIAAKDTVPYRYLNAVGSEKDTEYIYLCGRGWEVTIGLIALTDEDAEDYRAMHKAARERAAKEAAEKKKKEAAKKPN